MIEAVAKVGYDATLMLEIPVMQLSLLSTWSSRGTHIVTRHMTHQARAVSRWTDAINAVGLSTDATTDQTMVVTARETPATHDILVNGQRSHGPTPATTALMVETIDQIIAEMMIAVAVETH